MFILLHNFRDNSISFQIQIYLRRPLQPILFISKAEVENWQYFEPKCSLVHSWQFSKVMHRFHSIHAGKHCRRGTGARRQSTRPAAARGEAAAPLPCSRLIPPCTAHAYLSVHTCLPGLEDTQTLPPKTVTDSGTAATPT